MATIPAQTGNFSPSLSRPLTQSAETTVAIPWYIWCATIAVTSATVGGYWDISWHESIGRDTFWTPAHMAIQLCGVLAGIAFGYLILHTTFAKNSPLAPASVHIFGFRAPLGAFIASWGGIAMLTSAPFDNWWHDAYGIDVKIVSPPHILLIIGVYSVVIGTLVLTRRAHEPLAIRIAHRRAAPHPLYQRHHARPNDDPLDGSHPAPTCILRAPTSPSPPSSHRARALVPPHGLSASPPPSSPPFTCFFALVSS